MIPYFDAHCDTVSALFQKGGNLYANSLHVDMERAARYSPYAQVFAVWNGHYREKVRLLRAQRCVTLCRSAAEVRACPGPAALLSVEGAEQLGCSVARMRRARARDGLVMISLCWNSSNSLCGAAVDGGAGLTAAGRVFTAACQEAGVAVDLSHASEKTFWDVIGLAKKPVLASHSDSAALCADLPRNLTDAQFTALVSCGGGAGLNLCPDFLGLGRDLEAVAAHAERFLSLGGERALFIGADFDGIDATPAGVAGVQDMEKLYELLLRRNLGEDLVRDIFWGNLLRILEVTE